MTKIICKVASHLDKFYLPDQVGAFAKANEIIKIDSKIAKQFLGSDLIEIFSDNPDFNLDITSGLVDEKIIKERQDFANNKNKIIKLDNENKQLSKVNKVFELELARLQKENSKLKTDIKDAIKIKKAVQEKFSKTENKSKLKEVKK